VGHLIASRGQLALRPAPLRRLLLIGAASVVALVLGALAPAVARAAARAAAASYCVHQVSFLCPPGSIDEGADLQSALSAAEGNPSHAFSPNVITIGPGAYRPSSAGSGFTASSSSSYPLEIIGAGVGQTTLTADSGAPAVLTLNWTADSGSVLVSALSVTSNSPFAVKITGGVADHVEVTANPPGADGVWLVGSTLTNSTVLQPGGSGNDIFTTGGTNSDPNEVDDVTAQEGGGGVEADGPTTIHRARLIVTGNALNVQSAPVYIDDSLLEGTDGIVASDDPSGASVNALNDTLIGRGIPNQGVWANSNNMGGVDIQIINSIVRFFDTPFLQTGTGGLIVADHVNYSGTSTITVSNPVAGDPTFVNLGAGDFHLAANSPLIDASSMQNVGSISSTIDLDGNARVVPVMSASTPVDIGAFEYQHRAPTAVASATPSSATTGSGVSFDGSGSSDPDDGDTLIYSWSFDDGTGATGETVQHAFSTPGAHTATLTVTDPTGLASAQTVTVTVAAPVGSTSTPGGTPTTPGGTSTTPGGTTGPPPRPQLRLLGKPSVNGNKVTLKLSCRGSVACSPVDINETTVEVLRAPTRRRAVQVGSAVVRLSAGQTKTVTLTLNRTGKTLLARVGKLQVTIKVTMPSMGKMITAATARATLRQVKKNAH
jgi:PKD domain